jgi:hypothetical protein
MTSKHWNWRTTLAGLIAIASLFVNKPAAQVIATPEDLAIIAGAMGLMFSRDAANKNSNTPN